MARRFRRAGVDVLGFVGRSPARVAEAIAFCGAGRVLQRAELRTAHVVVFATGDGDLQTAIGECVAAAEPRSCSLWLHTSGRFGLDVFAAAGPRIRRGALHPVVPMPDAASGERALAGAPVVVEGDPASERLLRRLAALLGTVPVPFHGGDRTLYHAACSLAANGLTALRAAVDRAFEAAAALAPEHRRLLADALMGAALRACSDHGAVLALSGPVRRGDAVTIARHDAALAVAVPGVDRIHRALMLEAVRLVATLPAASRTAVLAALGASPEARS